MFTHKIKGQVSGPTGVPFYEIQHLTILGCGAARSTKRIGGTPRCISDLEFVFAGELHVQVVRVAAKAEREIIQCGPVVHCAAQKQYAFAQWMRWASFDAKRRGGGGCHIEYKAMIATEGEFCVAAFGHEVPRRT